MLSFDDIEGNYLVAKAGNLDNSNHLNEESEDKNEYDICCIHKEPYASCKVPLSPILSESSSSNTSDVDPIKTNIHDTWSDTLLSILQNIEPINPSIDAMFYMDSFDIFIKDVEFSLTSTITKSKETFSSSSLLNDMKSEYTNDCHKIDSNSYNEKKRKLNNDDEAFTNRINNAKLQNANDNKKIKIMDVKKPLKNDKDHKIPLPEVSDKEDAGDTFEFSDINMMSNNDIFTNNSSKNDHPRPRGRAPSGMIWNMHAGAWESKPF